MFINVLCPYQIITRHLWHYYNLKMNLKNVNSLVKGTLNAFLILWNYCHIVCTNKHLNARVDLDWITEAETWSPIKGSRFRGEFLHVQPPSWKLKCPGAQRSHFCPVTPGWQRHWPLSSQSNDLDPNELQWHGTQPWAPCMCKPDWRDREETVKREK